MNCCKAWLLICFSSYRHPFLKDYFAHAHTCVVQNLKNDLKIETLLSRKVLKNFCSHRAMHRFLDFCRTVPVLVVCLKPLLTASNIGYVAKKIGHIHPFLYGCEFYGDVLLLALFFPNMGLEPISHTNTSS